MDQHLVREVQDLVSNRYITSDDLLILTIVNCSMLNSPVNGMINCSLGDDGVPSYEDTCSFTCNTGYELTGSDTRTCESNGSWSNADLMCNRGIHFCMLYSYT